MPDTIRHTLGLIGRPLTHSFSATFFAEKFRRENMSQDFVYKNFELQDILELQQLLDKEKSLLGLNVTIPYKKAVLPFLDSISQEAEEIGAVNTISITQNDTGKQILHGDNTDSIGFRDSLSVFLDHDILPDQALILGTGGSSEAIQFVLNTMDIPFYLVSRSDQERSSSVLTYPSLTPDLISRCRLIINTTPLGMYPQTENAPHLPYDALTPQHYLFDLIYNPAETLFLKMGRKKGAQIQNGLQMLQLQAEASWKCWTKYLKD